MFHKFTAEDKITIDVFLEDIHELTKYLLCRFQQKKLYLVGHSWGSVLGLEFVQKHSELVKCYIGCGQVINMQKTCKIAYEYALKHANKKHLPGLKLLIVPIVLKVGLAICCLLQNKL